jgi:hypothetical protein
VTERNWGKLLGLAACVVVAAGSADARLIRSGGSSDSGGGTCGTPPGTGGGGNLQLAVFDADGTGGPGTVIPDQIDGAVYAIPEEPCPGSPYYLFLPGEMFEFEGSAEGVASELLASSDLDVEFEWTIGGFSFFSDDLNPSFDIPPSLFDTEGRLPLSVIATFTPAAGKAFYFCERPNCVNPLFLAQDQELTFTGTAASVAFAQEVPLPGAGLLMGGGLAWFFGRRRPGRKHIAAA